MERMKAVKKYILLSVLLGLTECLYGQNSVLSGEVMEDIAGNDETVNWDNMLEELEGRIKEPYNLNTVTKEELEQLPFLSDKQIENLLAYRFFHGDLLTTSELQLVRDMDKVTIDRLLPFVCVLPSKQEKLFPAAKNLLKHGKHQVLTRLDVPFYTRKGYEKDYRGNKLYHSLRYDYRYGDYLQLGVLGEKDAGEPMFARYNGAGYDHYSFHLMVHTKGVLKTLALGDYRLSYGQGLLLSSDFLSGKSFSMMTIAQRSGGIKKSSSTDEYNYFRGVALCVEPMKRLEVSAFYSRRVLDGTVKNDTVTSIDKDGQHRTDKEAAKRGALTAQLTGGNATYRARHFDVGVTGIYYFFNRPYEPALREYSKYNLRGERFYNVSVDYRGYWNGLSLAGEAAKGVHGFALLNRVSYELSSDYRFALVHRYYSYDYQAMYARSFGEGSTPQNENGWYAAAEVAPLTCWRFFVAVDMFSFPWWKYRISKPSWGEDTMVKALYTPSGQCSMYVTYRYKRKERDVTGTSGREIYPTHQHRFRYRVDYALNHVQLRATADYTLFGQETQGEHNGYLCSAYGTYAFSFPLKLSAQGCYFHTDNYDTRLYVSETGLLNTFDTPSYYGRGFRLAARAWYDFKFVTLIVKFGETIYQDRSTISSGDEMISGHTKADMQMQLRMKF
jgi:hypothetical protein